MDRATQVFRSVLKAYIEEARQGMTIEEEQEAVRRIADHFAQERDLANCKGMAEKPTLTLAKN